MISDYIEKHVGDDVYVDGYTSMAQQNSRFTKITEKKFKFDPDTGEKFPIYLVDGNWYDGRTGDDYNNPNSMYYIEI